MIRSVPTHADKIPALAANLDGNSVKKLQEIFAAPLETKSNINIPRTTTATTNTRIPVT
jgi:hypothetical protein